jgi:hypothetical protein
MEKANLEPLSSFITVDGSAIRELAGPAWTPARHRSLAEATLEPGGETAEHDHPLWNTGPARWCCSAAARRPTRMTTPC